MKEIQLPASVSNSVLIIANLLGSTTDDQAPKQKPWKKDWNGLAVVGLGARPQKNNVMT